MCPEFDFGKKTDKDALAEKLQSVMSEKPSELETSPTRGRGRPRANVSEAPLAGEEEVAVLEAPSVEAGKPSVSHSKPPISTANEERVVKPTYVDKGLKIEIRPIPNRGNIREFSEQLEHYTPGGHTIGAFPDPVTMKWKTGLTEADKLYLRNAGCSYDLSDSHMPGVPHPFWDSQIAKIVLKKKTMFLHPANSYLDFIKWKYLLVSDYVYSSEEEMMEGSKPEATHFIFDESVETEIKATAVEIRNRLIQQVQGLTLQRKRELILLVLDESAENKTESYLTMRFEEIFKNKAQMATLQHLLSKSSKELTVAAIVKSAIYKNVLVNRNNGIFFHDLNLGLTNEDVAEMLQRRENDALYLSIIETIK